MRALSIAFLASFLVLVNCSQDISIQDSQKVSSSDKSEIIIQVVDYLNKYYVFPEIAQNMADHISRKQDSGGYDGYIDINEFCKIVTADLRDISHDKHLFLFFSPDEAREVAARNGNLPESDITEINQSLFEWEREQNFGFINAEILDGNIGYLRIDYFSDADTAKDIAANTMRILSNSDAIIIDLRNNGGGSGDLIPLLASYFFDEEKVPLTGTYIRSTDTVEKSWTLETIPGKRMPKIDLYILTSSKTFSAAEDFSYSLKSLNRAIIVGERTKGGAHPVDVLIVKGSVLTQISIGNSINPITNSNWEGVGVKPDVEIGAEQALHLAHILALQNLSNTASSEEQRHVLLDMIKQIRLSNNGLELTHAEGSTKPK